jgi:RecB family exonuclease
MDKKLVCGAFQPGLEDRLVAELREVKAVDPIAPALVVVGSRVLGLYLNRFLADSLGALLNVRVMTLHDLAARLITGGASVLPGIPRALRAWTVRDLTRDLTDDHYFREVARRPGFASTMLATFDDLEESMFGVAPAGAEVKRPASSVSDVEGLGRAGRLRRPDKVRQVLELYSAFRERLEGSFSEESDLFEAAAGGAHDIERLFGISRVIFYGIYDLNPLQRHFLMSISSALDVVFMLPFEDRPEFDYARPALAWLEGLGFSAEHLPTPPDTRTVTNLALLQAGIARPSRAARSGEVPATDDATFALISAPGEAPEVSEIAREVLVCARDRGVPFGDMAVFLRVPVNYRRLLVEEFDRRDIPYYLGGGLPLDETREGRTLLMLCGLAGSGYPRKQVIDFLRYAPLDGQGALADGGMAVTPDLWNKISANANVIGGRAQWEERLEAFAGGVTVDEFGLQEGRPSGLRGASLALRRAVGVIFDVLDAVPETGTALEIGDPLLELYLSLTRPSPERETVADAVRGLIEAGASMGEMRREDVLAMLGDHLASCTIRRGRFRAGINILSVMEARGVRFRVVFVPGMVEKAFPVRPSEDPVLLDGERSALNTLGLGELPLKKERAAEERLLLTLACGGAQERLVFSYPRLDPATGRARMPSIFMLRAAETVTGKRVNYESLEETSGFRRVPLASGQGHEPVDALSLSELRAALALSDDTELSAAARAIVAAGEGTGRALELIHSRHRSRRFSEFDGVLPGFDEGSLLRDGTFRATELEEYTMCPYRFFHSRVLGLTKFEEPEEAITIDPAIRGQLVHSILKEFYSRSDELGLLPLRYDDSSRHKELLDACARAGFARVELSGECGLPLPWRRERDRIMTGLTLVLEDAYGDTSGFLPSLFEVGFGKDANDFGPLEIELADGERVAFRGRIDRVDRHPDGASLRVVDYKTGKMRQTRERPFLSTDFKNYPAVYIQTMIYLLAARAMLGLGPLQEPPRSGSEGRSVSELLFMLARSGRMERVVFGGERIDEDLELLRLVLARIRLCVESGLFFFFPSRRCDYCDYASACPAERVMIYGRKRGDRAIGPAAAMLTGEMFGDE